MCVKFTKNYYDYGDMGSKGTEEIFMMLNFIFHYNIIIMIVLVNFVVKMIPIISKRITYVTVDMHILPAWSTLMR